MTALLALLLALPLRAEGLLERVDIAPPPGAAAPLTLRLRDSSGAALTLGEALGGKPALLTLGYSACPALCASALNGALRALRVMPATAGQEFALVTVSIDPGETAADAARLRARVLGRYRRPGADWRFLTGDAASISRLTESLGFRYARDPVSGEYAHAAALFALAPDGRLARVLYGVDYAPRDLRLALAEAAQGRTGLGEKVLLYCFAYDPSRGRYGPAILRLLRAAAVATICGLLGLVWALRRRP